MNEKFIKITVGKIVTANMYSVEFNLTEDKEYIVLNYDADCILIENDLKKKDWYSLDYFKRDNTDNLLKDYLQNLFDDCNTNEDVDDLSMEIETYLYNAKRNKLNKLEKLFF